MEQGQGRGWVWELLLVAEVPGGCGDWGQAPVHITVAPLLICTAASWHCAPFGERHAVFKDGTCSPPQPLPPPEGKWRTADLGGTASTSDFTKAIIDKLE